MNVIVLLFHPVSSNTEPVLSLVGALYFETFKAFPPRIKWSRKRKTLVPSRNQIKRTKWQVIFYMRLCNNLQRRHILDFNGSAQNWGKLSFFKFLYNFCLFFQIAYGRNEFNIEGESRQSTAPGTSLKPDQLMSGCRETKQTRLRK